MEAVRSLVRDLLEPINNGRFTPENALNLERFVEESYLPYVSRQKRPSTSQGYRDMWNRYLKPRCGYMRMREFRTADG